jgi:TonB family protein
MAEPMPMEKMSKRPVAKAKASREEKPADPAVSRQTVIRQLRKAKKRLKVCYDKHVSAGTAGPGRVMIEVTIGKDGRVRKVRVLSGAGAGKAAFEKCLLAVFKRLRFPAGAGPTTIKLPLVFR